MQLLCYPRRRHLHREEGEKAERTGGGGRGEGGGERGGERGGDGLGEGRGRPTLTASCRPRREAAQLRRWKTHRKSWVLVELFGFVCKH